MCDLEEPPWVCWMIGLWVKKNKCNGDHRWRSGLFFPLPNRCFFRYPVFLTHNQAGLFRGLWKSSTKGPIRNHSFQSFWGCWANPGRFVVFLGGFVMVLWGFWAKQVKTGLTGSFFNHPWFGFPKRL